MNPNEQEFEQVMRTNKATIYTVCYMFSNDQDVSIMPISHDGWTLQNTKNEKVNYSILSVRLRTHLSALTKVLEYASRRTPVRHRCTDHVD